MMLNGGKIKEIQVKLLLSSRSEMHKVIEAARQSVPILTLTAPNAAPTSVPAVGPVIPTPSSSNITAFSAALGTNPLSNFNIPGIGNPQEIPQPAVIEIPAPMTSPTQMAFNTEDDKDDDIKPDKLRKQEKDRRRSRSRTRSRDRERKDRKRDRRDRSRSRERRRRDRSRSRERRDRKRDRKDRSRSRERSPSRRSRDKRGDRKSPLNVSQDRSLDGMSDGQGSMLNSKFSLKMPSLVPSPQLAMMQSVLMPSNPMGPMNQSERYNDPALADTFNKLQELGKKRNPNAFQGDQQNGGRFSINRGGGNMLRGGGNFRRENRPSRFEEQQTDCCVAIRNVPNHTSYGDVRRFFPFMIDKHGIKMINDSMGRRTGNIYVRFCDSRSKQLALQKKTNELKGAQVSVEPLQDEEYESAVDSFLPFREENDDEDPNLVIAETEENSSQSNVNILKLTDLPHFVKEHDIMKTFSDFSLLSITLKDCRITRSKVAYVHFVKAEDAKLVLERKETYLFGRRHPTIVTATNEEYEKEKSGLSDKPPDIISQNGMEQLQEPPGPRDPRQRRQQMDAGPQLQGPSAIQQSQLPFFSSPQFPVQPQNFGAHFPNSQFGAFSTRPPGAPQIPRATVNNWTTRPPFSNPPEQVPAAPVANAHVLSVEMENEVLDCILMKGLPQEANDRSIVKFLSDTGAVPARIHIMLDSNGAPSGECFCEFRSIQEAVQAAAKHGQNLDECRLTIDLVSKRVVEEALEGPNQSDAKREGLLGTGPNPVYFEPPRGGFTPRGSYRGRGGFERGGFDRGGYNRGGFDQGRGGFDQARGGFDHGRGEFTQGRGGFRGRLSWADRGARGFDRGRGRGFGRGRGGMPGFENGRDREMRPEEETDPALEDFGAPGCVVSMENVPFRATIDDILAFFTEFELSQDDVIRRYNDRGQPTGDARVAFRTQFDAQRAVQTCHLSSIHDRRIHLCVL